MASTPSPDTGTVLGAAGAAAASAAVNAPVAAVAPMKWRRSILMAFPRFREPELQEARRHGCAVAGHVVKVNSGARRVARAEWPLRRARAPHERYGASSRPGADSLRSAECERTVPAFRIGTPRVRAN